MHVVGRPESLRSTGWDCPRRRSIVRRSARALGLVVVAGLLTAGCTDRAADPVSRVGGSSGSGVSGGAGRAPVAGGPMRVLGAHGSLLRGQVGTRVTDGLDVLFLDGEQPAEVLAVRSVGGEEGLRFLGARLAGPERRIAAWSQLPGYPPSKPAMGELVDAVGAVVLPREETPRRMGYELLLGYEVVDDSEPVWRSAIEVVYRVGGEDYLWQSPSMLVYCPEGMTGDQCFEIAGDP